MRADQPSPNDPDRWLLPLAVDELGDALSVVRALTNEADATAEAARAVLDDEPTLAGAATEQEPLWEPETSGSPEEAEDDRGSGAEPGSSTPQNLDPAEGLPSAPPVEQSHQAPAGVDDPTTEEPYAPEPYAPVTAGPAAPTAPASSTSAAAAEPPVAAAEPPVAAAEPPVAAAESPAATTATAAVATGGGPGRGGGGNGGGEGRGDGDRRHLAIAAAFIGVIAIALATLVVVLSGGSSDSRHEATSRATPTASKGGSGFTMTMTAPPASSSAGPGVPGSKASGTPQSSGAATSGKPSATTSARPAVTVASQCSGSGWQQRRLDAALGRISYPYTRVGVSVSAAPGREGVLAIGNKDTRVVTAYVRSCSDEPVTLLAAAVADQMAQLIDAHVLTDNERVSWMRQRGFPGGTAWHDDGLLDYASVFTLWQVGSGYWRSSMPPPTAQQLQTLKRWYAAG